MNVKRLAVFCYTLVLACTFTPVRGTAQQIIHGIILSAQDSFGVGFAVVRAAEANVAMQTDEHGYFSIVVPSAVKKVKVEITGIGVHTEVGLKAPFGDTTKIYVAVGEDSLGEVAMARCYSNS